jgi:FkbM family methyltransferase
VQLKETIRDVAAAAGWTVHRWPSNRYDAMHESLLLLARAGFAPQCVIDVGANVGNWTDMAVEAFDAREHHLVEPQPECHVALARFEEPRFTVHKFAVTSEDMTTVQMVAGGTGAWVTSKQDKLGVPLDEYPARSLDGLIADRVHAVDRPLLKLDVESHELEVLRGAPRVMDAVEVIVTEFQLFRREAWRPLLSDVIEYLRPRGFHLYDFAALSARPRDLRLRQGDAVFVKEGSPLFTDTSWE